MDASTNKRSFLIGTRSLQNRKRCLVNNENAKSVKLFPRLNYWLLFFTSSECCCNWFMVKPHTSDIPVTCEYIRVAYGWHTSTYEWVTDNIRVHTSDIRMTYKYIPVTYGWYTSTYKWHTDDIGVYTSDMRITREYIWVT